MRRPGRRVLIDALLVVAIIAGFVTLAQRRTPAPGVEVVRADPPAAVDRLSVHVAGAVGVPGVVTLPRGSRVADAVTAAGGGLPEADLDAVNLARRVEDAERVTVPRKGDRVPALLDLNRATRKELIALAGIGEKTADRIIESRAGAPFTSTDDLVTRNLLSAKVYEAIRDQVTATP